jgi:hypothetical protein
MLRLSQIRTQIHLDGLPESRLVEAGCNFASSVCADPICSMLTVPWDEAHPAGVPEESIPRIVKSISR